MNDKQGEYLEFNTDSITELIKQKLAPQFPDVIYEGSSTNIITEAVASVFTLLLFQLNRTASNSSFSKTQSLETLIQHTKILGYNPTGWSASTLFANVLTKSNFDHRSYTIPRYSFITTDVGTFSTADEYEFTVNASSNHTPVIFDMSLKSGSWMEHPLIYSEGVESQKIVLSTPVKSIEHNSIHIYIRKDRSGEWEQWERVESLFLSDGSDKHFEARLNTSGTYDITFGDGVNGKIPDELAPIAIYYMAVGEVYDIIPTGEWSGGISRFTTDQLNEILGDILDGEQSLILNSLGSLFTLQNSSPNTLSSPPESLESIRKNAPITFQTQNRLVTKADFKSFVSSNFSEFVSDVLVLSNQEYVDNYLKYYYELGLNDPHLESRALYNQVNFADACNFNNIYIFIIPKSGDYTNNMQKKLVVSTMSDTKTLTAEIIPSDPIYINFGIATPINAVVFSDIESSYLEIIKDYKTNRSNVDIKNEVYNTITKYFYERGSVFEESIDLLNLNAEILSIEGVQGIYTVNGVVKTVGIQFYKFNPKFPDKPTTASTVSGFDNIFVPRLYDNNIANKITIKTQ